MYIYPHRTPWQKIRTKIDVFLQPESESPGCFQHTVYP